MSEQPIIIEEPSRTKPHNNSTRSGESDDFFGLLDEVQNYDCLAKQIRGRYEEAMLLFAGIKFTNPFALTTNSHRCLPAFLSLNNRQELTEGYTSFTQEVDEDKYLQEFEQQEEIEQECETREGELQLSVAELKFKSAGEGQVLYRFNVLNQQAEVISASNKFKQLLTSLLKLTEVKRKLEQKFSSSSRK